MASYEDEDEHEVYGGRFPTNWRRKAMHKCLWFGRKKKIISERSELEDTKKRLMEIEEEAGALCEMQAKVEKEMGSGQQEDPSDSATLAEKEEMDSWSLYVGNVDYACTPEDVQQHVQSCGTVNRVSAKRTNVPGLKQFRGRRPNASFGYPSRRAYIPPFAPPYSYGRVPRMRWPTRYGPY